MPALPGSVGPRPIVLMTASKLARPGAEMLATAGCELRLLATADPAAEMARVLASEPVSAIISRTLPVDERHIASCPSLRVISRHGVGYNNVNVAAATARGIPVTIADGANGQSVAELAIGLMLAVARRIPALDAGVRARGWDRTGVGRQLAGRRLGLVAYGRIGRAVAGMARGIGMEVSAFDPHSELEAGVVRAASLDELLAAADVLSLHAPLTPETRGLIGAAELARLPAGAIVVNTSRGELIDEAALAAALAAGHVAGAGLDTLADEPPGPGNPLLGDPRVVLTPHVGGSTDAALDAVAVSAARNVLDVLEGRGPDPRLLVNPGVIAGADAGTHPFSKPTEG